MSFLLAVQFLTVIPVRLRREITEKDTARAMAWFPVVGSILGLILALSDRIAVIFHGEIMGILDHEEATAEKLGLMMAGEAVATA